MQNATLKEMPAGAVDRIHRGELLVKNILCPVDFSSFSEVAFRLASSLAWHFRARVFLQHTVLPPSAVLLGTPDAGAMSQAISTATTSRREELQELANTAGVQGPEIDCVLQEGDPVSNILETIRARNIDLVVIGTHGHRGFRRAVLGSVTEQIIHRASCPVLVVSHPQGDFLTAELPEAPPFRTILLATDFSRSSDRALAHALRWASEWGGRVVLFHTVDTPGEMVHGRVDLFPEFNPAFEKQLALAWNRIHEVLPEQAGRKCSAVYEVRHGNAADEIIKVAQQVGADLIVMGARGRGETAKPWGSVSSAVVRQGKLPVLVVRRLG